MRALMNKKENPKHDFDKWKYIIQHCTNGTFNNHEKTG